MKTKNLLVLAMTLSFATAYAQSDESVLNSDPISVDGYLAQERPVTDGELEGVRNELRKQKNDTQLFKEKAKTYEKLSNQTEKMIEKQDEYVDSRIESTRAIKEFNKKFEDNQKKLRCIMEESDDPECDPFKSKYNKAGREEVRQDIRLAQAAPAPVSTAEVAPAKTGASFETIKLLPYAGATSYNGKVEQLEAEFSGGLRLESNITTRFTVGVGFNYSQLKTDDYANGMDYMRTTPYINAFGAGREINFRSMGLDIYGKFFLTESTRFRPYLGAGLGYQRGTLKYAQNSSINPYYMGNYTSFGGEEYRTSYATGNLMVGSEIMITEGFGLNIEGAYSTGLGGGLSSESAKNPFNSPDQNRLRQLGEELVDANALSIFIGGVVNF